MTVAPTAQASGPSLAGGAAPWTGTGGAPGQELPAPGGRHRPARRAPGGEGGRELARRAARAGGWTLLGRVSVVLAAFVTSALAARMLTPAGMAGYAIGSSAAAVGGLVGSLGLAQVVVRFTASALAVGERRAAARVVRRCLLLGFTGLLTAGGLYLAFAGRLAGGSMGGLLAGGSAPGGRDPAALPALLIAALMVGAGGQTLVGECHRGLGDARRASVFGGPVAAVLLLAALVGLRSAGHRQLHSTGLFQLAAAAGGLGVLAGIIALVPRLRALRAAPAHPAPARPAPAAAARVPSAGRLLAVSMPLLASVLLYAAFTQVDLWTLGATRHGSAQVAAYAVAARVASLVALPAMVVNGALLPMIAELMAQDRRAALVRLLRTGAAVSAAPAVAATALFAARGGPLLGLAFGPVYRQGAPALVILAAGNMVAAWAGPAAQVLAMCGRERALLAVTTVTAAATAVAILLVVPAHGPVAAAALAAGGLVAQSLALLALARAAVGDWVCAVPARAVGRRAQNGPGRRGPASVPPGPLPLGRVPAGWPRRRLRPRRPPASWGSPGPRRRAS